MKEARALHRRDPEGAALLAAQSARYTEAGAASAAYDPIDIYTRMAREFGSSDPAMDAMDYVRFFGYVDRLSRQQEKERAESEPRSRGATYGDAGTVAAAFPEIRRYEGRTAAYGR